MLSKINRTEGAYLREVLVDPWKGKLDSGLLLIFQHVQWFTKAVTVSLKLLIHLMINHIRKIRHDIKSAVVSYCYTTTCMTNLRGKVVVSNHVNRLTSSRGFLQLRDHVTCPSLEQRLLISKCLEKTQYRRA